MIVKLKERGCTGLGSYFSCHADTGNHLVGKAAGYPSAALRSRRPVLHASIPMDVDDLAEIERALGGVEAKLGIRDDLRRVVVFHHKAQAPSAIHACYVGAIGTAITPVAGHEE